MNSLIVSSSPIFIRKSPYPVLCWMWCWRLFLRLLLRCIFRGRIVLIIAVSVLTAVATEAIIQKLMKKPVTIRDWSAVVTGVLLAFNLPPAVPLWLPAIGSAIAIALVKQAFGGLGHNFMNPALAARAILLAAWPVHMTAWFQAGTDAISTATPLAILKGLEGSIEQLPSLWEIIIGTPWGCIGETSNLALLLGAAYLLFRRIINWRIPFTFIGTVALLTWIIGPRGLFTGNGIYHIFSGGLILGAFFMATDYSSSPVTPKGQIIMGIGCGILTSIIRIFGGYPEGVSYSILLMNIATPLIDRYTMPRIYGEVKPSV